MENQEQLHQTTLAPSKTFAILQGKCPQCRKGNMFKYGHLRVDKFDEMHSHCPHCNLRFEVEPGFWYGAMFMSYGFTILLLIISGFGIYFFFGDPSAMGYVVPITVISLLAILFNFRFSRATFLHWFGFIPYKEELYNHH